MLVGFAKVGSWFSPGPRTVLLDVRDNHHKPVSYTHPRRSGYAGRPDPFRACTAEMAVSEQNIPGIIAVKIVIMVMTAKTGAHGTLLHQAFVSLAVILLIKDRFAVFALFAEITVIPQCRVLSQRNVKQSDGWNRIAGWRVIVRFFFAPAQIRRPAKDTRWCFLKSIKAGLQRTSLAV